MGSADFIKANPFCAFCGAPSVTAEHCPPKAMFQNKQWPEGFQFPACDACNAGTRDHDLVFAMLARIDPVTGDRDGKAAGMMKRALKRNPGMFAKMMSVDEDGQLQASDTWKVTDEIRAAVNVLATKLAKGVFFLHTRAIFPRDGGLMMTWYTNSDVIRDGGYKLFESLSHIAGDAPTLKREKKELNDQFEYKFSLSPEKHILALQARFATALGFVVFGSTTPGLLEANIAKVIAAAPRTDGVEPFRILQSTTLPLGRLQDAAPA